IVAEADGIAEWKSLKRLSQDEERFPGIFFGWTFGHHNVGDVMAPQSRLFVIAVGASYAAIGAEQRRGADAVERAQAPLSFKPVQVELRNIFREGRVVAVFDAPANFESIGSYRLGRKLARVGGLSRLGDDAHWGIAIEQHIAACSDQLGKLFGYR